MSRSPSPGTGRGRQTSLTTRLRPAQWPEGRDPSAGGSQTGSPADAASGETRNSPMGSRTVSRTPTRNTLQRGEGDGDMPATETHWTLREDVTFEPAKFHHLLRLPHRLSPTNFATWMRMMESTLTTVGLYEYCLGHVPRPTRRDAKTHDRWVRANALVRCILLTNMTEEANNQAAHFDTAAEMWDEAARLFAGRTDWTLTISALVTTHYVEGEDIPAHIAKMKKLRRDLILMHRNIDDDLFACFLRTSMPSSWNYVFLALPSRYTSAEVERRILHEHGIRTSQQNTAAAYSASSAVQSSSGKKDCEPKPGEPYCTNCKRIGHWVTGCWSKGGGAEGTGPRQRRKKKTKGKGKEKTNQAVEESTDSEHSSYMTGSHGTYRPRHAWILDGGSTTHTCNDRSAFATYTPVNEKIGSVDRKGPQLTVEGRGDWYQCELSGLHL